MTNDQTLEILVRGVKQAAIDAGDFIGHHITAHNIYTEKPLKRPGDSSNPVTTLDKEGEKVAVATLSTLPIAHRLQIHGEEHVYAANHGDIRIDIDPIDGTKSWVRGEFLSSVSIGAHLGEHHVGAVYDFMRGILYATDLKDGKLIATATYRNHGNVKRPLPVNDKMILNRHKIPSDDTARYEMLFGKTPEYDIVGSIALALAHVAYGALDGLVMKSNRSNYYDVSGGLAVAKASGAIVTDYSGKTITPNNFSTNGILVLRPHVLSEPTYHIQALKAGN